MKIITALLFLTTSFNAFAGEQNILEDPKVDLRVELLSIVFRLAESHEYSSKDFVQYVDHIEEHYDPHKNHPLINFIKKVRDEDSLGYDRIMNMAISISPPPNMQLLNLANQGTPEGWKKTTTKTFLKLLNEFYRDSNSEQFFAEQAAMYQKVAQRFRHSYDDLNLNWYQSFYGQQPKGAYRLVNAVGNGGHNYGPNVQLADGTTIIYGIIGAWTMDKSGLPIYEKKDYFSTILHEINHSFINHLVAGYAKDLSDSGRLLFNKLEPQMSRQAYTKWQTMFSEALVRAAVIKYLNDHDATTEEIERELAEQLDSGFVWTAELVNELERYSKNRKQFPTLESFMPEIVGFFRHTTMNIDKLVNTVADQKPRVVSVTPDINQSTDVDPDISRITFTFDRVMRGSYSFHFGKKGREAYPAIDQVSFADDRKSVTIEISLVPDKDYQLVLTGLGFKSLTGFGLVEHELNFKTTSSPSSNH